MAAGKCGGLHRGFAGIRTPRAVPATGGRDDRPWCNPSDSRFPYRRLDPVDHRDHSSRDRRRLVDHGIRRSRRCRPTTLLVTSPPRTPPRSADHTTAGRDVPARRRHAVFLPYASAIRSAKVLHADREGLPRIGHEALPGTPAPPARSPSGRPRLPTQCLGPQNTSFSNAGGFRTATQLISECHPTAIGAGADPMSSPRSTGRANWTCLSSSRSSVRRPPAGSACAAVTQLLPFDERPHPREARPAD